MRPAAGMSVRLKLALTIFATGLLTALLVIATVVFAFQRFENETAYRRGMGFLSRVVSMYDNIFDMHEKDPAAFQAWLRGLVLFAPDTELYLLDAGGIVLAKTGPTPLKPGTRVALGAGARVDRADGRLVRDGRRPRADGRRRGDRRQAGAPRRGARRRGRGRLPVPRPAHAAAARPTAGTSCAAASPGRRSAPCSPSSR